MDQQGQNNGQQGPGGRRLHIAHRRSPSELTPLMSKLAIPSLHVPSLTQHDSGAARTCPAD